jgi:hypothetical protein
MNKRKVNKVNCLICNIEFSSVGLDSHLKYKHKITSKEYKERYINIDNSNFKFNCLICNNKFKTERLFSYHLNKEHNIKDKLIYINSYIFNNIKQLCKCGCNKEVKILKQYPYKRDYINGHNENGMKDKLHSNSSKDIITNKCGLKFYNELILLQEPATAAMRSFNFMNSSRKIAKCHQQVLVFIKGNIKESVNRLNKFTTNKEIKNNKYF